MRARERVEKFRTGLWYIGTGSQVVSLVILDCAWGPGAEWMVSKCREALANERPK